MRETCLNEVFRLAKSDARVYFVGSDLGFGTLKEFDAQIPDRFFMEGIAEAHVVGMASGMALEGKIVYVNTISTFLTRRCFEQVVVDACLHNLKLRFIGNGGGVVYAPLGPTHLAIEDLSIFRAIPNMTIVAPADADEMRRLMPLTLDYPGPIYIRLGKGYDPIVSSADIPFQIGKALPMRAGHDVLLLTTGVTLKMALEAADILAQEHLAAAVVHLPTVKPLDDEAILAHAREVRAIISIEENTIVGGLGSAIAELVAEANFQPAKRFKRIGLPDAFPDKYGSQAQLMEHYGISREAIVATAKALCRQE